MPFDLTHSRPFVWHVWDGHRDGFHALVSYHALAAAQDLQTQLERILVGEPPLDRFVRWKPLHHRAIGREPDINDGVRLNIRPFLSAELRTGGRKGAGGSEFDSNRWNDLHYTNAAKQAARERAAMESARV